MSLSTDVWLRCVAAASRAPSPHNAQPARWRLRDQHVELHEDPFCWLGAGDASGRDNLVALGMAWEAMALALAVEGVRFLAPEMCSISYPPRSRDVRLIAVAQLAGGAAPEELASYQDARRCFRGTFAVASADALRSLDACIASHSETVTPIAEELRVRVAQWYDSAAAAGLRNSAVARELYAWMRFSRSDPRWSRDGLAADCLMLGGLEAWVASWLMRPSVVRVLSAVGLTGMLVSEGAKVLSASRLIAVHAGSVESPFACGRRWYRFWLALTACGFCAVPMSALVDAPAYADALLAAQPLPQGLRLFNVMRVGPTPEKTPPRSSRRPIEEFLLR